MFRFIALCLLGILTAASGLAETITVSEAVSLKESMTEIAKVYKQETGDDVQFNFGASGTLATQIRNGAPVDIFISAADKQVKDLIHDGVAEESTRHVVATNSLVVIVPADKDGVKEVADLADAKIKRIAVGDPKVVPAGEDAVQAFKTLKLDEKLRGKLIYAASVRQVLAYVERGEVDAGIVYKTDATAGGTNKIAAKVDSSSHDKIEYPAVMIKASGKPAATKKFLEFLKTEKASTILKAQGFELPDRVEAKQ